MPQLIRFKMIISLALITLFCPSAMAVIIEGSFTGQVTEWYSSNMEVTDDAQFFRDENSYAPFTGEFWYDTELAGQPEFNRHIWSDADQDATYSGPHDWLHVSLKGANGAILDLTSSGHSPTFTSTPAEEISVVRYQDHDLMMLSYQDGDRYTGSKIYRKGSLDLEPQNAFVNDLGLIQNYATDNPFGYIAG